MIGALVESGNWMEGTDDCLNDCIIFMDGEEIWDVAEPDRTITLQLKDGVWEVTGEGY